MRLLNKSGYLLAAVIFSFGVSTVTTGASAQDCPRGTLDARYCDRNGDLVADLPLE